jgi:hypothetical protein
MNVSTKAIEKIIQPIKKNKKFRRGINEKRYRNCKIEIYNLLNEYPV